MHVVTTCIYMYVYTFYSGKLGAVGHIDVGMVSLTTVIISWKHPFSFKDVRILYYTIDVLNTATKSRVFVIVNGTYTTMQRNIDDLVPGNILTVTIVAINGVGAGDPAFKNFTVPVHVPTGYFYSYHVSEF